MQMQRTIANTEIQTISSKQSLECVQMLLKAGLGCITYMRGLLPAENFGEYRLSSKTNGKASVSSGSFSSDGSSALNISGVTIKTLNRGFTNEGDRMIDYLENGIFEAVEKQYLQKVIFGIYLDSNDPNNIVEAYTFNFHYHKLPGSDAAIPIMTLGDQMFKMSLTRSDPVSEALKKGKMPTLGEVKRSIKAMIKSLITTINQMENLPKNRYGNFKLFFNEDAPDDYQPPHFQAADAETNRWFFTTHATGEVPERTSIGKVDAGWHGLEMKVVSVSSYLPSITEDNNAPFAGITSHTAPKLTPVQEARIRIEDAQLQKKDALERSIVWDADEDEDADGEIVIDEGVVLSRFCGDVHMAPVGVRSEDGAVRPLSEASTTSSRAHAQYGGISEATPIRVGDLNVRKVVHTIEETQQISATQEIAMGSPTPAPPPSGLSLPASDLVSTNSVISTQEVDTQYLQDLLAMRLGVSTTPDSEMLDMETQVPAPSRSSCVTGLHPHLDDTSRGSESLKDKGQLDCDCGISIDDSSLFCEGGCDRWFHVWCMGYHGARDTRLPVQFICLDCRLRGSHDWDVIAGNIHADMIARYKDLALFRRAIKICEVHQPSSASLFREHTGCDTALAGQLLTRLEEEGFIAVESTVADELGIGVTRSRAKKGKKGGKAKAKTQKELQKTRYVFLAKAKRSKAYSDYFNPQPEVENRLMGLCDAVRSKPKAGQTLVASTGIVDCDSRPEVTSRSGGSDDESQTQEATQNVLTLAVARQAEKRKAATDPMGRGKRVKVSIGSGVDLCD